VKKIYAIYGTGGHGREIMPELQSFLEAKLKFNPKDLVFIDDELRNETFVNNFKTYSFKGFLKSFKGNYLFCTVAVSAFQIRQRLTNKCKKNKVQLLTIQSPDAKVYDTAKIGEGSIISPLSIISPNVDIGESFHLNRFCNVAHDCKIGNFVTFGPGVKCNGNIIIEDNVYIGSGAIIRQGTKSKPLIIGKNSIIGAGSVVLKDVPSNVTVIGNPARVLNKLI
jgi:sugar O-acyltransferase (sialic acid O-acetyltransferase NeuD family)